MAPRRSRLDALMSPAQRAEAAQVALKGTPGPWLTHAQGRLRSRPAGRASLAGPAPQPRSEMRSPLPTGGGQGNAGLIRGAPTTGAIYGGGRHDSAQYPVPVPSSGTGGARDYTTRSRTGLAFAYGHTIAYDRHIMAKTGTERQRAHPDSTGGQGLSPLADGPVRPAYLMVSRVLAPRYGNNGTRHLDNNGPFAATTGSDGRRQPLGTQDGSPSSAKYGGTPGLTHIYGVRGTAGVVSPVPRGAPGDGPQRIRGGAPHGLHSHAQPNAELRTRRAASTPQQRPTRRSLPANSARSGQSWSQNVQHLAQAGHPVPVAKQAGRLPGNTGGRLRRG
jgi:hypothetical protein